MSAISKEIRSFLVVSEAASIREAAHRLNISAPALSRQMQILERSYGTRLLVRTAGGVSLTPEGALLRAEAQRWVDADAAFVQRLHRGDSGSRKLLRLGAMEGLVTPVVPALVQRLERHLGPVELDLVVGSNPLLHEKSEASELDVVLAYNLPRLAHLSIVDGFDYELGVCHAPDLGVEGSGPITMQEALQWPLCLPSAALSMHTRLMAEILSVRVNPKVALNTNSIGTILSFLRDGHGIAFLPWPDVSQDVEAGRLAFRPIRSRRMTERLSLALCRGNSLGDATGRVLDEIRAVIAGLAQAGPRPPDA